MRPHMLRDLRDGFVSCWHPVAAVGPCSSQSMFVLVVLGPIEVLTALHRQGSVHRRRQKHTG